MKREDFPPALRERIEESDALFADGFEAALVAIGDQAMHEVAIYDRQKCLAILVGQGMTADEALEYFEFNVSGSWVGERTPVFVEGVTLQPGDGEG